MFRDKRFLGTLFLLGLGGSAAAAPVPSPSREAVQAEIEATRQASQRAAQVFLDGSRAAAERLAALAGVTTFFADEDRAGAVAVLRDPREGEKLRIAALRMVGGSELARDSALLGEALAWMKSPATAPALRLALAEEVRTLLMPLHGRREIVLAAFRPLVGDRDPRLSKLAITTLAGHGDDWIQQKLIQGLRQPAKALLPPEESIGLLGLDAHGDALPVFHQILLDPPSEAARLAAIRHLGTYEPSRPLLVETLQDPGEPEAVRQVALGALYAGDPEGFPRHVLPILRDDKAGDGLRLYSIQAVERLLSTNPKSASPDLAEARQLIHQLAETATSTRVRAAAQSFESTPKP